MVLIFSSTRRSGFDPLPPDSRRARAPGLAPGCLATMSWWLSRLALANAPLPTTLPPETCDVAIVRVGTTGYVVVGRWPREPTSGKSGTTVMDRAAAVRQNSGRHRPKPSSEFERDAASETAESPDDLYLDGDGAARRNSVLSAATIRGGPTIAIPNAATKNGRDGRPPAAPVRRPTRVPPPGTTVSTCVGSARTRSQRPSLRAHCAPVRATLAGQGRRQQSWVAGAPRRRGGRGRRCKHARAGDTRPPLPRRIIENDKSSIYSLTLLRLIYLSVCTMLASCVLLSTWSPPLTERSCDCGRSRANAFEISLLQLSRP